MRRCPGRRRRRPAFPTSCSTSGGLLSADPRNQRADLALHLLPARGQPAARQRFRLADDRRPLRAVRAVPQGDRGAGQDRPKSPLYWQARLRTAALDAQEDQLREAVSRLEGDDRREARPDRRGADAGRSAAQQGTLCRSRGRPTTRRSSASITVDERHWPVFFGRGIVLERTKQWPKAEADMKKALELSPEQPHVLNYLGYSWIDQGLHLDEGMKMLQRATELRPDDGAITDSVGWAFYRLGQYDKAVEWLERASEQKGDDADHRRASRRRLLARRPQSRGALPVGARAQPEAGQGPPAGHPGQARQRAERRPTTSRPSTRRRPTKQGG